MSILARGTKAKTRFGDIFKKTRRRNKVRTEFMMLKT